MTGVYTGPSYATANGTTATTVQAALSNETAAVDTLGTNTASTLGGGTTDNTATGALAGGRRLPIQQPRQLARP